MSFKTIFSNSFFLKSVFLASLFVLVFISSITYKHNVALTDSTELVMQSYKVRLHLEKLMSYLKDAETGQRGFIITRDSIFLEPYLNAREKVELSINELRSLTADNHEQQKQLDSLSHLTDERFKLFESALEESYMPSTERNQLTGKMIAGKNVMDSLRLIVNKMSYLETVYLRVHKKKYEKEISFTPRFTLYLMLFSLLIFILSYYKINKDIDVLQKSNKELLITTQSIQHAETIGEFCFTQWDLETNKLFYSDNLYRLLGCEPQSFAPTIENFLEFVHPDDRNIVNEGADKTITNNQIYPRFYRVIRKDGQLRYFKSMGKILVDDRQNKMHIGIIKDVTNEHLNNITLEERNRELEQSNKELASFNQAASHDLQEPLRKIQTFISRIIEKEMATLSEAGKDYFAKIEKSATRMRILIDDLLLFSRATKSRKDFERTDLNVVLENAQHELSQIIEERKAVIQSVHLPSVNGIAFQLQQLFINLLGNSLKYNKPGLPPIIKINCEESTAKENFTAKANSNRTYCRISFTDNGLGFDQQYAESIFILFNRLHQKNEYPGTGIGLAICKKIVENHEGFITAEGRPGHGCTFTIYLPM